MLYKNNAAIINGTTSLSYTATEDCYVLATVHEVDYNGQYSSHSANGLSKLYDNFMQGYENCGTKFALYGGFVKKGATVSITGTGKTYALARGGVYLTLCAIS